MSLAQESLPGNKGEEHDSTRRRTRHFGRHLIPPGDVF